MNIHMDMVDVTDHAVIRPQQMNGASDVLFITSSLLDTYNTCTVLYITPFAYCI